MSDNSKKLQENYEKSSVLYKRLLTEVKHLWPLLIIAVIGSIFYSAADSSAIYLIKPLLNKGFSNGGITEKSAETLKMIGFILIILFSIRGIGSFVSSFFMGKLGQKIVLKFRQDIYNRFLDLPASFFDKYSTGKLLSRLLYNVDQVTSAASKAIITVVQDGSFVIGLLIVMFVSSWQLCLVVLLLAPILAIFITWISRKFRSLSRNTQESMGMVTHIAEESLRNFREIRVFNGQEKQKNKFEDHLLYTYSQQIKTMFYDGLFSPIIQVIAACMLTVILLIVATFGIGAAGHSWLSAGSFVTFFASSLAILKPIKNLTKVNVTIQKAVAATEDIFFILDYKTEEDLGKIELQNVKGNIELKNLSFSYGEEKVLNSINLDIKEGETIALVGKSGSGKTTIVNLLTRFYHQDSGEILIDNNDIKNLSLRNLRSQISTVSQNVNLFEDTVFNNVAFGLEKQATEEQVINALKKANAWEFVQELPEGLETNIGLNGSRLSGGQRQRISIARALLKDAPILIFDEATSALDNESERAVQQALDNLTTSKTTLVIAHRLSTVENADKIVVMKDGNIVEYGKHEELLKNNGLYSNLYHTSLT